MVDQVYIHGLLRKLQQAGHSTVLRCGGKDISGDVLRGSIFRYAKVLGTMAVGRGRLLAMFAPNRPDALALRYAAHVLGVATVYLSMPSNEVQRRTLLKQMAPDLLVVFPETATLTFPSPRSAPTKPDPVVVWISWRLLCLRIPSR